MVVGVNKGWFVVGIRGGEDKEEMLFVLREERDGGMGKVVGRCGVM